MSVLDPDAVLAAAHTYAKRGWRVIPLHRIGEGDVCTCRAGAACRSAGKHPIDARWQNTPAMSGADVQATFEEGKYNVGIATGTPSGFWVLDLDTDKPGAEERFRALLASQDAEELPPTYTVRTGGGGYQFYFSMPDFEVSNSARRLPDGVDVRGTGGQVVAPPSVSGKGVYSVLRNTDVLRAPAWLEELVRPAPPAPPVAYEDVPKLTDLPAEEQQRLAGYTKIVLGKELRRLDECKQKGWGGPGWNQTTFEVACVLVELANSPWCPMTMQEAHEALLKQAPQDGEFGEDAISTCFRSAVSSVAGKVRAMPERPKITVYAGDPLTDPTPGLGSPTAGGTTPSSGEPGPVVLRDWTDLGNARRMVDLYGDRLRWVRSAEDWAVYDKGAWRIAGTPAAQALVQDMVEGLPEREAALYSDNPGDDDGSSQRDQFLKWAKGQQMSSKIDACLKQSKGRSELQVEMTDFDSDPFLFNCANGIVDLRTGELLPHDHTKLLMLQSPVEYDPAAPTSLWDRFLERCLPDPEVRDYLQLAFGYSLTGSMAEQAMFLHHGSGANGKSVFLVVASHLAGTYGQVVPRETLLAKSGSATEHPTSVARMRGRRFLQASETAAGRRLDEETVKGLTGGEQQTARFMGADFFDFTPTGKIHFITNHLPRLTDAESIWRRLHLVAWTVVIPVDERDPHLAEKIIKQEAAGVLAWAVRGAVKWNELIEAGQRLPIPASMKRDLSDYRTDQDILGEFVEDRLERDDEAFTATSDIYGAYAAWCFAAGIRNPMTAPDLARALAERKIPRHRTGKARGFRVHLLPAGQIATDPLLSR